MRRLFKPETLGAVGKTKREATPRAGLKILRDSWGVAHVYGKTASDVMWGAGWVAAEDRGLILQLIRGPGRIAALDGPAYDQSREFVPSSATETRAGRASTRSSAAREASELLKEVDAYTAGLNAYLKASKAGYPPWTRNDTVAAAAVLAGQYGVGGGDETRRARAARRARGLARCDRGPPRLERPARAAGPGDAGDRAAEPPTTATTRARTAT